MASLANDPGGTRRVLVVVGGKRKTVRLGKIPKKQAEGILRHIEALAASRIDGSTPPDSTAAWLAATSETLRGRLVRAGLIEPVASRPTTLAEAIDDFKAKRFPLLKTTTQLNYQKAFGKLLLYFGGATPLREVTEGHADDYRNWLLIAKPNGQGLAASWANRLCSAAWTLFRRAVRSRVIDRNPFDDVQRGSLPAKDTGMIDEKMALDILDKLPTAQLRLLFGLSRWGGLRVPSEPRVLHWRDIDWERQRFLVHSPKTEHHVGHDVRWVPIFPELAPLFDECFAEAAEGQELVLPFMKTLTGATLSYHLKRALAAAGVSPWPRLWHSMRVTRQTELEESYPTHVVCAWLGNSPAVARKHYLKVTDEHFAKAAQKAAQKAPAACRTEPKPEPTASA